MKTPPGFLLVNLEKLGVGGFFETFRSGMEYFEELGTEMEIAGRYLHVGVDFA